MNADSPLQVQGIDLLRGQYENMLNCIRCGLCLSVCPTYQISFAEEEGPRGRIALARGLAEGHLPLSDDLIHHAQTCLLCEACTAVCPAGVRMEPLGIALRSVIAKNHRPSLRRRLLNRLLVRRLFADMRLLRRLCTLAWIYQRLGLQRLLRASHLLRVLRLADAEALLPAMQRPFFVAAGQRFQPAAASGGAVAMFAGCIMSTAFAAIDRATVRVLTANGLLVEVPAGQGCCGALHLHSGGVDDAKSLARRTIEAFEATGDAKIIVNAAGCGSTLKGYGHLLAEDREYAERAERFSARVSDFSEFLVELPPRVPGRLDHTVTWQAPCHLAHAQRIREAPRRLLRSIPGLLLIEMKESDLCCGSAGIYNLTQAKKAQVLQQRKLRSALDTGADWIVTANPGCQLQLAAALRTARSSVRVLHIAELLDEAYCAPVSQGSDRVE